MKKRMALLAIGILLMGAHLAACYGAEEANDANANEAVGGEITEEANADEEGKPSEQEGRGGFSNEDVTMGKVMGIDGSRITVQIGSMGGGRMGGGRKNGEFPEQRPEGADKDGARPMPDGSMPPMPEGSMPPEGREGGFNREEMFKESGETREINLDDGVTIQKRSGRDEVEASIDDIKEGTILNIIYKQEDAEKVESVTIFSVQEPNGQEDGGQGNGGL